MYQCATETLYIYIFIYLLIYCGFFNSYQSDGAINFTSAEGEFSTLQSLGGRLNTGDVILVEVDLQVSPYSVSFFKNGDFVGGGEIPDSIGDLALFVELEEGHSIQLKHPAQSVCLTSDIRCWICLYFFLLSSLTNTMFLIPLFSRMKSFVQR